MRRYKRRSVNADSGHLRRRLIAADTKAFNRSPMHDCLVWIYILLLIFLEHSFFRHNGSWPEGIDQELHMLQSHPPAHCSQIGLLQIIPHFDKCFHNISVPRGSKIFNNRGNNKKKADLKRKTTFAILCSTKLHALSKFQIYSESCFQ